MKLPDRHTRHINTRPLIKNRVSTVYLINDVAKNLTASVLLAADDLSVIIEAEKGGKLIATA